MMVDLALPASASSIAKFSHLYNFKIVGGVDHVCLVVLRRDSNEKRWCQSILKSIVRKQGAKKRPVFAKQRVAAFRDKAILFFNDKYDKQML